VEDKFGKDIDNDNIDNLSRKIRLEHLISFSDAIFAFSITFMAISIQIPNFPVNHMTEQQFMSKLLQLGPQLEIYAVSFMIVGVYWISYHQVFNLIKLSHAILVWLNLLFLFFITLISFGTDLDFKYGTFHSVFVIFASILAITGSLLVFIWLSASKDNLLIDKTMGSIQRRLMLYELSIPPGIFLISIGISFIDIRVAQYLWILVFVTKIFTRKRFSKIVKR
jgi:uncharacterized membrane protein